MSEEKNDFRPFNFFYFLISLVMICAGGYLFLNSVSVYLPNLWHRPMFHFGGYPVISGFLFIPFIFGVLGVFYKSTSYLFWGLVLSSSVMFLFGIVTSLHFKMAQMTVYELLSIIVLLIGGIGLLLRSLSSGDS